MCATIYNMQLESQYRRQRGLKGKGAVFTTIPMAGSVLNSHPGHVVASLDKGFNDDCWLRSSSKFTWEEAKRQPENLENGQLLSG